MKKTKEKSNLSTSICKTALSLSMASLSNRDDECTIILFEPKQPESMKNVDLKKLRRNIR